MKNKKLIIILLITVMLTTGCAKRFRDNDTKKVYTSNIICQPTSKEMLEIYEKNKTALKVDLDELSDCKHLTINANGYEGLWTSVFVKPLAWLIVKLGNKINNYGLSIIILGIFIRVLLLPTSIKATAASENMNKAQKDLNALEKKYINKTDQASLLAKNQEMMAIYKKYNINPVSSCLSTFIQIPFLFAFLEAIYRVPIIFEGNLLWFNLGRTPWEAIKMGEYYYIILVILITVATYLSFKSMSNTSANSLQKEQMKLMKVYMVIFITFASFTLPTAIAMYWIATSGFTVIQTYALKAFKNKK